MYIVSANTDSNVQIAKHPPLKQQYNERYKASRINSSHDKIPNIATTGYEKGYFTKAQEEYSANIGMSIGIWHGGCLCILILIIYLFSKPS